MKTYTWILAFLVSTIAIAQNPIEKNVGDFTIVKVYDRVVVNLIKSDAPKVIITGRDADQVVVENKDGMLKVKMDFDRIFDGNNTFVQVYYTDLNIIDGNEGARIIANELISQERIEIRTQEGAHVKAGLEVDKAELRAVTGGIIEVTGTVNDQEITVNTGGIFEGKRLHSQNSTVLLQAGGEVEVYATERVDVKVRAGGDVEIYGNPKSIKKNKIFGGRIQVMK